MRAYDENALDCGHRHEVRYEDGSFLAFSAEVPALAALAQASRGAADE